MGCPMLGPNPSQTLDGLGPVRFLPRQMGIGNLKGLPPEYSGKQLTAPVPDRAFNVILDRWPPPPPRLNLKLKIFRDSKDTWTVGEYLVSSSETCGPMVRTDPTVWRRLWEPVESEKKRAHILTPKGAPRKHDQVWMFVAMAEANRKADMAHEAVLGLKDEVVEVRRDNAHLEGLLASEAISGRREDFDEEVQQESRGQPPREVPTSSRSQVQGERQSQTRPLRARAAVEIRH
ncbi:hypothetical protein PanWU01x14_104730 [Parasponia andersonii]|uniref:Uncharacterized protein n=1 Tax=Parasponia andersonii TaxID=3476 RepID=A0A2P5D1Y2_PARAD|nr:hypothetical protein PanWU01x14_104730 [Parasponia andersonii]